MDAEEQKSGDELRCQTAMVQHINLKGENWFPCMVVDP